MAELEKPAAEGPDYSLNTLGRALNILDSFRSDHTELTLSELAERVDLPRSTVFRYLQTLDERGYLSRDPISRRYHPGPAMRELAAQSPQRVRLREIALPYLNSLSEAVNETINLAVRSDMRVEYVAVIESTLEVRIVARVGDRNPMHCTALGKVILAHLSEEEVRRILGTRVLERSTKNTVTSVDDLLVELKDVRAKGFAIDRGEHIEQVVCVGAPVFDHERNPFAAISISGLMWRFSVERAAESGPLVRNKAAMITKQLAKEYS